MSVHTCCFSAAVRLTRHNEPRTLGNELVDFVENLPAVTDVQILEVVPVVGKLDFTQYHPAEYGVREFGSFTQIDTPSWLQYLEGKSLLFDSMRRVERSEEHGVLLIFPVGKIEASLRFVQIQASYDCVDTLEICMHAVRVYANQLNMLTQFACDALTGLLNRQTFDRELISVMDTVRESVRNPSSKRGAWLAIIDIDFFKRINDGFGHLIGDEILILVANLMRESFRLNDLLFRYGGEEFVIVLMDSDRDGALTALERFRSTIEQNKFPLVGDVTVSIGCADVRADEPPTSLADRADKALYHAKNTGRNQVISFDELEDQSEELPNVDSVVEFF